VATAAMATAVPTRALRTGTAVRPRPGSSAMRMPVVAETGSPQPTARRTRREGARRPVGSVVAETPAGADAARHAGTATQVTSRVTRATPPRPSTVRSASTPGTGSAERAGPMGISGEQATATPTDTKAASTPTPAARDRWSTTS
jgi:hypothetical protein